MRQNRSVRILLVLSLFFANLAQAGSTCREEIAFLPFWAPTSLVGSLKDDGVYFPQPTSNDGRVLGWIPKYFSGGKRLRPLMVYLSALVLGHSPKEVEPLARIVELVHTASLIHDDIIDGARERRGELPLYLGEGMVGGLIAGPWIQAYLQGYSEDVTVPQVRRRMSAVFQAMGDGELLQRELKGRRETTGIYSADEYFKVAHGKTGALFGFSSQIVSLHFGMATASSEAWKKLGEMMGVTYQMRDDFQDAVNEPNEINYAILRFAERTNDPAFLQIHERHVQALIKTERHTFEERRAQMQSLIDEIALTGSVNTPDHKASIETLREMVDFVCNI